MAIKYTHRQEVKSKHIGSGHSDVTKWRWEDLAHETYSFLYSRIWGLLNDKKYFSKSKRHHVLYAKEQAQHCFYLNGVIPHCSNNEFMKLLHELFSTKGRLAKYTLPLTDSFDAHANIQITPYVFIRKPLSSGREDRGLFSHYTVSEIYHTLGFNHVFEESPFETMQKRYIHHYDRIFALRWFKYSNERKEYGIRIGVRNLEISMFFHGGDCGNKYIYIPISRFNNRSYNLMKNICNINAT